MEQKTALWYFIMVFAILIALHTLLPDSRSEIITYSQFKVLVKQNLVTDLVVEEATVGSITPQPEGRNDCQRVLASPNSAHKSGTMVPLLPPGSFSTSLAAGIAAKKSSIFSS